MPAKKGKKANKQKQKNRTKEKKSQKKLKPGVGWVDEPGTGKKKRNIPEKSQGTKCLKTAFGKN